MCLAFDFCMLNIYLIQFSLDFSYVYVSMAQTIGFCTVLSGLENKLSIVSITLTNGSG